MSLEKDSGRSCWNCSYGLAKDDARCPRCGIPAPTAAAPALATAVPVSKARRRQPARRQPAIASENRKAAPAAARTDIVPVTPAGPRPLARVRATAGQGLGKSFDILRRIGSLVTAASGRAAGRATRLLTGTASSVSRGASQLVRRQPAGARQATIDVDALRRENARTLADVAELLLRETREENDVLKDRLARLEAVITVPEAPVPLAKGADAAAGAAERTATGRSRKTGAPRASRKRTTTAKRRPRRAPDRRDGDVPEMAPIALAPELEADLQGAGDGKVVRMESRRTGTRRRGRAQGAVETAG